MDDADRYRSTRGPPDGPIRRRDNPPTMGVDPADRKAHEMPIGVAYRDGSIDDDRGAVATFRLVVGEAGLPGLYLVDRRRFVPVEGWRGG